MAYDADGVIAVAKAEIGYREKKSGKDLYSKTANAGSGNYTKFNYEMHKLQPSNMDYPAPWCDAFNDWCHYIAAGKNVAKAKAGLCGDFNDYTVESAKNYQKANRWGAVPHKGDQIFFKNSGGICHTGIVERVTDTRVYTIEGNKGNEVKQCSYPKNATNIAGYGYPKYDTASMPKTSGTTKPATTKPATTSKPTTSGTSKLAVDGVCGAATVKAWQKVMGTTADGVISGQSKATKKNHEAITAVKYSILKRGSDLVRAVQKKLGVKVDGLMGEQTVKAIQKHLGVTSDGYFGKNTTKALQKRLNEGKF